MATGSTAAVRKAAMEKQKSTCASRLVPRLTRYLFATDKSGDKQKVRKILTDFGYAGPGWDDEARAVACCESAGHDMSKFQRANSVERTGSVAGFVRSPEQAIVQIVQPMDSAVEKLKSVTIILMQAEKDIIRQFKDGRLKSLSGVAVTIGAALEEIRR